MFVVLSTAPSVEQIISCSLFFQIAGFCTAVLFKHVLANTVLTACVLTFALLYCEQACAKNEKPF